MGALWLVVAAWMSVAPLAPSQATAAPLAAPSPLHGPFITCVATPQAATLSVAGTVTSSGPAPKLVCSRFSGHHLGWTIY